MYALKYMLNFRFSISFLSSNSMVIPGLKFLSKNLSKRVSGITWMIFYMEFCLLTANV